jgi:hypothetical protein
MSKARGDKGRGRKSRPRKPPAPNATIGRRRAGSAAAPASVPTDAERIAALERELTEERARAAELQEQQAATAEILRVISRSPADLQPVFQAIAENAVRLCGAEFGATYRFDGEQLHLVAHHRWEPEILALLQKLYPMRPDRTQVRRPCNPAREAADPLDPVRPRGAVTGDGAGCSPSPCWRRRARRGGIITSGARRARSVGIGRVGARSRTSVSRSTTRASSASCRRATRR